MQRYISRRLALFLPTLILVSMLVFFILRILPGNVAVLLLAGPDGEGRFTAEEVERVEKQLGLDEPLPVQYLDWVAGVLTLDFGESEFLIGSPVATEAVSRFLEVSLELAVLTIICSLLIAIPMGVLQSVKQDTVYDIPLRLLTIGGVATPAFVSGTIVIIVAIRYFGWLPPVEYKPLWVDPVANLKQMFLPALVLGYTFSASVTRMVRSAMLEVLREDYIRTARAKGLIERTVIIEHALRTAMLPVITIVGTQLGALLSGTVIAEQLFNLPGVGRMAVTAINDRDYALLQFIVLMFAMIYMITNLIVDLSYAWLDPRIRYG